MTIPVPHDPSVRPRIVRRWSLIYSGGADAASDRPAHVRAASALAWVDGRLAIVQDDANFVALMDSRSITGTASGEGIRDPADQSGPTTADSLRVSVLTLPAGPGGRRQFDDRRGNKAGKLDLESCVTWTTGAETTLVAFGSGSTPARERLLVLRFRPPALPEIDLVPAPALYSALRASSDFAGSELNVEGAVLMSPAELRLFGRGNGAPREGRTPVNASCSLDWPAFQAYLRDPSLGPPEPHSVHRYDLGLIDGIPFGFTDAVAWKGEVLFSAAAEASPDAVRDGRVAGSAIGFIPDTGRARSGLVLDERGALFPGKIEGLAMHPNGRTLFAVADEDDPAEPSVLCEVALE